MEYSSDFHPGLAGDTTLVVVAHFGTEVIGAERECLTGADARYSQSEESQFRVAWFRSCRRRSLTL
jgi:hypothetical protein